MNKKNTIFCLAGSALQWSGYLFWGLCIFPFILDGQVLSREHSLWVYEYPGFWAHGYTFMRYEKDTLVNDSKLYQFSVKGWYKYNFDTAYQYRENGHYFFKDSAGVLSHVDFFGGFNEQVIIDLNKLPGDSIITNRDWRDPVKMIIQDRLNYLVGSISLPAQSIRFGLPFPRKDTILPSIGFIKDYILPWDYFEREVDGGIGGPLLCFKDDMLGTLRFNAHIDREMNCDQLINQLNSTKALEKMIAFPNPFDEYIGFKSSKPTTWKMWDGTGNLLMESKGKSESVIISTGMLPPGIYFIQLGRNPVQKILKL